MRGYMQIESVWETSKVGNSKGAKRLTVAELEKAKALSALGHSYRAVGGYECSTRTLNPGTAGTH
jgi:hypothetical protein